MATRIVEGKKPYTGGKAIEIDENKVISLNLRDENNLIIYDAGDDEIYVDLQLDDEITPTSAFPIGVNVGRVIVDNGWDKPGTIISAETTSGDNIKIFYADEGTLRIDNGTGTFKQIYFKADVDALLLALRNYIDGELAKKQNGVSSNTAPSNPSEGDLWYDTTNSAMKVWDGTAWQSVGTGGGGSDIEYVTQAEYNALLPGAASDGKHYFIYTGNGRLPAEYQEVEYIQSSGRCYIDTGYSPSGSYLKINTKFNFNSISAELGNTPFIYGYVQSNYYFLCRNGDSGKFEFGNGGTVKVTGVTVYTGTDYEIEVIANNGTQTIDINGNTTSDSCGSDLTSGNLPIFCRYSSSQYEYFATNLKMYSFKIYSSADTLERDLVPCYRKADSVIGMYDLVNDVFYTNSGSGTFTKGPNI